MAMDDLPRAIFEAECRRYPEIEVGEFLSACDLRLPMLRLMDHSEAGRLIPCDAIGADEMPISEP